MSILWNDRLYERACATLKLDARGYRTPGDRVAVADASTVLILQNARNQPQWVVICAAAGSGEAAGRTMERAQAIRGGLRGDVAAPILQPLGRGELEGRGFAVYPYCRPIRLHRLNLLYRHRLGGRLFDWLRQFTRQTVHDPSPEALETNFRLPLEHLAQVPELSEAAREAARGALREMENQSWRPHHVAMHNDLWLGNVLEDEGNPWGFVIIDWGGAQAQGYGMYDLVRLAGSLEVSGRRLRREVDAHCAILGCERHQSLWHLAAALGHLGTHLEQFPLDRYVGVVDHTLTQLQRAL